MGRLLLVSVDFSDNAKEAVNWAVEQGYREGDTIAILSVADTTPSYPAFDGGIVAAEVYSKIAEETKLAHTKLIQKFETDLKEKKIPYKGYLRTGVAKYGVVEAVEELKPDMLIMGTRGMGAIKRALLGSVSDYALHHCDCPVVIVRPKEK
eukprot:NODE_2181_length_630_cov_73.882704_g2131_i0.p1 GENE.NODE_2181_length_630_cov_73.882704_g2131_i0~~NODE_2181_length_630_cov_73.882704_g2131_i0.p1  ORF type:complete len:151 (+),score=36.41 NODE_2181_length_630_cov_73.882704_g2131_i0:132-584(+)